MLNIKNLVEILGDKAYEIGTLAYVKTIQPYLNKTSDKFKAKEYMIRSDLTKRNFTKRQQNIILLILNYSYSFGKEYAVFPKLQDFELCGVGRAKVRTELDKLVEMKVVQWDMDSNEFSISSPLEWEAPFHSGYRDIRTQEIFLINLRHKGIGWDKLVINLAKLTDKNK
ncbi:replication protein [Halobacillus rhizosphaerae]|uniref:replication protein n=1 Tax=Halobacillus rhizosphaerae TaxID=3064889 RepID=UPI00398B5226